MATEALYREFLLSDGICTDTRKELDNRLFFALDGENFDGNRFVETALEGGCRLAICKRNDLRDDARVLYVADVLEVLQDLARHHRRQLDPVVLSITGSNGKTTTKELIARVLAMKFPTLATRGNLNNHLGVPLTLLELKDEEMAVIEMGANHPGEIGALARIAEPVAGMITNVGKAHLEGFGSLEGVLNAKGELYEYLSEKDGLVLIDGKDSRLVQKALESGVRFLTAGVDADIPVGMKLLSQSPFLEVEMQIEELAFKLKTSMVGGYNLQNMMLAAAWGIHFGVPGHSIAEALASYVPLNQRSQLIRGKSNNLVFDSYNANPSSMREAISGLTAYGGQGRTLVILGDMAEMGDASEREHRELAGWLEANNPDRVVLVGPIFSSLLEPSGNRLVFKDVAELDAWLKSESPAGYTILVKGSRSMKLESLMPTLKTL